MSGEAARYPLGYIAPALGSLVLVPLKLSQGFLEARVLEVAPNITTRQPEVVAAPVGALSMKVRTTEWIAKGDLDTRCGLCYAVLPQRVTFAHHAATSAHHASVARVLGVAA